MPNQLNMISRYFWRGITIPFCGIPILSLYKNASFTGMRWFNLAFSVGLATDEVCVFCAPALVGALFILEDSCPYGADHAPPVSFWAERSGVELRSSARCEPSRISGGGKQKHPLADPDAPHRPSGSTALSLTREGRLFVFCLYKTPLDIFTNRKNCDII